MNQSYPSVNDRETSWSDIAMALTISGGQLLDTIDFAGIKWGRKVEVGERRGPSGGRVMARTTGSGSQEASASIYRTSYLKKLLPALMAVAPTRGNQRLISLVVFDILVQHTPIGSDDIFTTKIKGCRMLGDSDDMKEGNDPDKLELTLSTLEVANIIDGQEVVLI